MLQLDPAGFSMVIKDFGATILRASSKVNMSFFFIARNNPCKDRKFWMAAAAEKERQDGPHG